VEQIEPIKFSPSTVAKRISYYYLGYQVIIPDSFVVFGTSSTLMDDDVKYE